MAAKKPTNITVYRKKNHMNIGIIVFGAIFVYLIVLVLLYLTDQHVSAYEVREGSILKDTAYTGLVVRSETVVNAEEAGYVNYFATEGSKVGAKTNVYTVSPNELNFKTNGEEETQELTAEEKEALLVRIQSFGENFKDEEFHDIYTLKDHVSSVLESKSNQSRQAQLTDMLETEGESLKVHKSAKDGIVVYSTDGYEQTKISDVTEEMIAKQNYEKKNFKDNRKVNAGDPVYKLITDDIWNVVILLNDETAKEMADIERVRVRFAKDNETAVAKFQIFNTKDANLGFLTFDTGMIRYAQERYLDLELILEDESGLKIPKSAVTSKDFYIVPEDYLTQGGNSKATGVLVDEGKDNAEFRAVEVYYRDNETGMVYLDPSVFEDLKSQVLIKPDSSDTYTLAKKKKLKGVYNINKGYAVFKQIKILCGSEEYYVVEEGNDYGLANYDHIALDSDSVKENDVVFQ